jgi:hypothetical protein
MSRDWYEILIPGGRGRTGVYARDTRDEAFAFARDAKSNGWDPGVWRVAGRGRKTHVQRAEWEAAP